MAQSKDQSNQSRSVILLSIPMPQHISDPRIVLLHSSEVHLSHPLFNKKLLIELFKITQKTFILVADAVE